MNSVNFVSPEDSGRDDCDDLVNQGTPAKDLTHAPGRLGADEALINQMGQQHVLKISGCPCWDGDWTREDWEQYALPWCERYAKAYAARAEVLAKAGL